MKTNSRFSRSEKTRQNERRFTPEFFAGTNYLLGLANVLNPDFPNPEAQPPNYVMKATLNSVYMTTKVL